MSRGEREGEKPWRRGNKRRIKRMIERKGGLEREEKKGGGGGGFNQRLKGLGQVV